MEVDEVKSTTKRNTSKKVAGRKTPGKRCWKGYKPVNGKKAYSKGSCRKA